MSPTFDRQNFVVALDTARKAKGLSLEKLAVAAGLSSATIRNYRSGRSVPGADDLHRLAEVLDINPVLLFQQGVDHDAPQLERRKSVPLCGHIPAGPPVATDNATEVYDILAHLAKANRYVLRVAGESMAPILRDQDLVLMEYVPDADIFQFNRRVCAVLLDGESSLKRVSAVRANDPEGRAGAPVVVVSLLGGNDRVHETFVLGARKFSIQGVAIELVSRKLG